MSGKWKVKGDCDDEDRHRMIVYRTYYTDCDRSGEKAKYKADNRRQSVATAV